MSSESESSESEESEQQEPDEESLKRKAEAARDMMQKLNKGMNSIAMDGEDGKSISDMTNMLSLAQEDNKPKRKGNKRHTPCELSGSKDLCDSQECKSDGQCRSGCCSQILTKGFKRCSPMLVGDYCPRALDPVFLLKEAFLDSLDEEMTKTK